MLAAGAFLSPPNTQHTHTVLSKFKPTDATTNPSLVLAAAQKPEYQSLFDDAVAYGKKSSDKMEEQVEAAMDKLV